MEIEIQEKYTIRQRKGISGSTLKLIAIASMVLDHIAAIVLIRLMMAYGLPDVMGGQEEALFIEAHTVLFYTYVIFRQIGRIAFPIFCFLLVEGFVHTHDVKKYLIRLFLFALISELPYDLAFIGIPFDWEYQNIYFTLLLGILAITSIKFADEKKNWSTMVKVLFCIMATFLCAGVAHLIKSDYDMLGVLAIVVIYLFRKWKTLSVGLGSMTLLEVPALLSMVPVYFYNGKRGMNIKWLFYLFYPVHIFLLYVLAFIMGVA